MSCFARAVTILPRCYPAWQQLAKHTISLTTYSKATDVQYPLALYLVSVNRFNFFFFKFTLLANYWCIRKNYVLMLVQVLRALNRDNSSATLWTLLGHANVELQELGASCIAYQQAVEHSHNDYRAWYGMGQSFHVLEFPAFALCYFVRAYALKTEDPRITTSLADGYLAIGLSTSAERCYWKSFYRGDPEKIALTHLAL
ncbi:hypothetical protein TTRE_0000375901 [Trichuris trichiura]|uniref:Uncharacterized protein n=1 Tax=Trichuris trichiura TaxID=36087 RepID=A0A077Z4R7_TRITR|nr:hypothetical protein TTRE_0000375901 [Trichuris trichiura]